MKVEVVFHNGRVYYAVEDAIYITPKCWGKIFPRRLKKLTQERENLKDVVDRSLQKGYCKGVFFLTFPDGKGRVIWKLTDDSLKPLEKAEDAKNHYCVIVLENYYDA